MLALIVTVTVGLSLVMMGAWLLQRRAGNAGWVDVVWSFAGGAAGLVYALAANPGVPWPGPRQALVALLVAAWSLRLGLHLAGRTLQGAEDVRYAALRREWGADFEPRMFWFLQIQAAAAAFLTLSVLLAARNPAPLGIGDAAGLALLAAAIAGEAAADAQLRQFRADPGNRGRVCQRGLWRWSRHPNYFFEWLAWLAYPCFAIDPLGANPWGWVALSGPIFMYWLLVHVSGIPPLEREMLRTRGEAYRSYQARTRAFLPLPLAGRGGGSG
jgi:steroid 5-alpha reductase family enzyme